MTATDPIAALREIVEHIRREFRPHQMIEAGYYDDRAYIARTEHVEEGCVRCSLDAQLDTLAALVIEMGEALTEARPYVFNRTQEADWRGETARDVMGRVDAALERLREVSP